MYTHTQKDDMHVKHPVVIVRVWWIMETVDAYFSAVGNPHNPLQKAVKDTKRCRLGWSKSWMGQAEVSVLQVCQLTELKQAKEWDRYPTNSHVSVRHSCQKTWESTIDNGHQAKQSETKLLIQENSKPQDFIMYTDDSVTKDQSGWGVTVKQGEATIHEDSAACMVSASSFTMEVEAVTGLPQEVTVRPHMPSSS